MKNRTFEQIVEPFQAGQEVLPPGVDMQTGIIAQTPPKELAEAILAINSQPAEAFRPAQGAPTRSEAALVLSRTVDKEITRLGRRQGIVLTCASMLLGASAGLGVYAGLMEANTAEVVSNEVGWEYNPADPTESDKTLMQTAYGVAAGVGALTGGVLGYVGTTLGVTSLAQRKAKRTIRRAAKKDMPRL